MEGQANSSQGARRPPPIVFMPTYSNPTKDRKKSENRKMVARWSMIKRTKPSLNPIPAPSSASSNASDRSLSPSSEVTNLTSASSVCTSITSLSPDLAAHESVYASIESGAPFGLNSAEHGLDLSHSPSSENSAFFESDQLAEPINIRGTKQKNAKDRSHYKASTFALTHYRNISNDDDEDDLIDFEELIPVSRKRDGTRSSQGLATTLATTEDPFDCLPIKTDRHTQELLYSYLNALFLSPALARGGRTRHVASLRQTWWFPLILESRTTMNALVAYIESAPDIPIKARNPEYLLSHVQAAYQGLREALSNPITETDDSICVAIILLMLAASRIGDMETFGAHAKGLVQLLDTRFRVFRANKFLRDRDRNKWSTINTIIYGPRSENPCNLCKASGNFRATSPDSGEESTYVPDSSHPVDPHPMTKAKSEAKQARCAGFHDMVARGYLSPALKASIEQIQIWSTVSDQISRDKLSAAVISTHTWVDERPGKPPPPVDSAFFQTCRLCLYLLNKRERTHSCEIVRRIASGATTAIRNPAVNISLLVQECPYGLLWLALVLGSIIEEDTHRLWFKCLLIRARHFLPMSTESQSMTWNFEALISDITMLFVWSDRITPLARTLWDECLWEVEPATVWMENPF